MKLVSIHPVEAAASLEGLPTEAHNMVKCHCKVTNSRIQEVGVLLCVAVAGVAWRGSRGVRGIHWWGEWTDTPMMPSGQEGQSEVELKVSERNWAPRLNL